MADTTYVSEFEWQVSNLDVAYPFRGVTYALGADIPLSHLISDASVSIPRFTEPVSMTALSSADAGAKVTLVSGGETMTFESARAVDYGMWRILTWADTRGAVSLSLVVDRVASVRWPATVRTPVAFVPRAIQPEARGVSGFIADGHRVDGDVTFKMGYSLSHEAGAVSSSRGGNRITITAEDGAGYGVAPCEHECQSFVATINKTGPNGLGDLTIEGVDCYSVLPDLITSVSDDAIASVGRLAVHNDCSPCCDCDDFGQFYEEGMGPVIHHSHLLAERYKAVLARFREYVDLMKRVAECKATPEVKLQVTPGPHRTAYVAMAFMNNANAKWPAAPTNITVTFACPDGVPGQVARESVQLHGSEVKDLAAITTDNSVAFILSPISCCTTVWVTFTLVWDGAGAPVPYVVRSSGKLGDITFNQSQSGFTLMPVNRGRE